MEKFSYIKGKDFEALPKTSGVYVFLDKKELVYIGKAINIKSRVKNHFQQPSYRDNLFIEKVNKIGFFETNSEIEALILEANLIKKHQPKYNVLWRDDKNYFYVALIYSNVLKNIGIDQKEKRMPCITIAHQKNYDQAEYIGPFVEGTALKKTLRFLRRVFPYYSARTHPTTKCLYCHLNLCPGPNPDALKYKKDIKKLMLVLQGKRSAVLQSLKKEMHILSKENKFEEAGKVRDQMYSLAQVMSHTGVIEQVKVSHDDWQKTEIILQGLLNIKGSVSKVECYDISNIQGKQAVGSMVVFVEGQSDKSQYRKFKIKILDTPNDIAMLKETLQRRFAHPEWGFPEIILIDGGIAQLNIAIKTKNLFQSSQELWNKKIKKIKIISIAKRNKELHIEGREKPVLLKTLQREIYNLVLQLDDEAHRFAISYHKKLRKKNLLQ